MNNVITIDNSTLTSMEVAEMVEKEHKFLMRDIRRYIKQLNECNLAPVEFFEESKYIDLKGETRPCYSVTKKGCEFIANKLTGVKGTAFTARYINRFHKMENELMNEEIPLLDNKKSYLIDRLMIDKNDIPKVPLVENWYQRNIGRIERMCERVGIPKKTLYHILLIRIGEKYNLDAARKIYIETVGEAPKYAMDIVVFFPELGEMADWLLDRMERNIYS